MIALAHAEEAPERHHGIGYLTGVLVDHETIHRAEGLAQPVINRRADNFVGGDEAVGFVGSNCPARRGGGALHRALLSMENKKSDIRIGIGTKSVFHSDLLKTFFATCM